jgi:hypothetical protein
VAYENCTYHVLEHGVHKFVFMKANKTAVDEHVAALKGLYETHTPTDTLNILIDLRTAGWPPMAYTMTSLRKLNADHQDHPKQRYAFLYSQSALISLAQSFFHLINRDSTSSVRFFQGDKELAGLAWLLNN